MNPKDKDWLCSITAQGCEHVFQQIGYDLQMASGQDEFTALEMVDAVMNLAAFEQYAGDEALAAFDLLTEEYNDWHILLNDIAEACRFELYG